MKFKHLLTVLLVLVICFSLTLVAVACGESTNDDPTPAADDSKGEETAETETLLITNGRFEKYTAGNAPYVPTSWTGSASSSSVDVVAGVIPMKQADYTAAMSTWGNLAYPGNIEGADEDNHVLLIYNTGNNAYTYSPSTQFSTTIGAYYKITVQYMVKRGEAGIAEDSGAYITFSGAAYHQFGPFAETDGWQTVTFYVAASQVSKQNVNVGLSMGKAGNLTSGYAFFDNVLAEKISAADYAGADLTDSAHTAKYSMLVPDGDFINSTSTDAVQTSAIWTGTSGTGNGTNSNSNYVRTGIVNTNDAGWAAWNDKASLTGDSVKTPYDVEAVKTGLSADGKVLAISNEFALTAAGASLYEECFTAYGFTNNLKMHIAPNTAYELSVWVYTALNDANTVKAAKIEASDLDSTIDHSEYGANIIFNGYGDYAFNNINTDKTWQKYTFYVVGSSTRYKDVNIELWLGKGGMNDATRASGTVYFDNITLTALSYDSREAAVDACNTYVSTADGKSIVVDIQDSGDELIANGNFTEGENGTENWILSPIADVRDTDNDVKVAVIDTIANADKDAAWWQENYAIDANPLSPHTFNPVLMINNVNPSAYSLRTENAVTVKSNMFYRIAVWVKTANIAKDNGITVALVNAADDKTLTSFTKINTADYENEMEGVNGYVQLQFYVKGSNNVTENDTTADDKEIYVALSFGTGNNFDTDEFLSGTVFVANVNMQQIDNSEYSDNTSTSTYSKSYSFAATTGSTSGSFADSKFDVVKYEDGKYDASTGNQVELLAPSGWTVPGVTNVNAGVLNVDQTAFVNELKTLTEFDFGEVYNAWADSVSDQIKADYLVNFGAPNVFMAYTTKGESVKAAKILNNTSSVSLTNSKYYIVRVYVRAIGTVGQVELSTTGNKETTVITFGDNSDTVGAWEEITFAIKTGSFGTVSATINLYIGEYSADKALEDDAKPTYKGIIFADSITCYSIDEQTYNTFVTEGSADINYTTDTFDTTSTSTGMGTISSSSWTGSGNSGASRVTGIYNRNYTTTELTYMDTRTVTDDDGNEKTEDVVDDTKTLTGAQVFDTTGLVAGADLSNGVLVINNQKAGNYTYKSSSITLASKTAYALTLDARTFNIAEGEFARIRIAAGSDNYDIVVNSEHVYKVDANGNYVLVDGANTYDSVDSAWGRYSIYIRNAKSSSVSATVNLMLGMSSSEAGTEEAKLVRGTALFDNVTFEKIDDATFYAEYAKMYVLDNENAVTKDEAGNDVKAAGADQYQLTSKAIELSDDYTSEPEDNDKKDTEEKPQTDSSLIWLYVTSIVIAAILIIVIVVWLIRRYAPKNLFKRKKSIDYDRNNNADESKDDKSKKEVKAEKATDDEFKD